MTRFALRRAAATYLGCFLLAVALSPHRHLNSIADLISDDPSDSGAFVQALGKASTGAGLTWTDGVFVDDDPCLACFTQDYVSQGIAPFFFDPVLSLRLLPSEPDPLTKPAPVLLVSASRSPPAIA